MEHLLELQQEIEDARRKLDAAAKTDVRSLECYRISVQLDKLIEEYLQYEKVEARSSGMNSSRMNASFHAQKSLAPAVM